MPAILSAIGICGVRIFWIFLVFPAYNTFKAILIVYPISLFVTAVLMVIAALIYRPTKKHLLAEKTALSEELSA